ILRECVMPFLLSLAVLTGAFLLGNLIRLANMVINKGVSLVLIGKIFLYYVPFFLTYTLPISSLIAVILTFGRFSADNEILAIRANGIHLRKLLMPALTIGVLLSLFALILNTRVIPYAYQKQRELLKEVGTKNPTALLEAGAFITDFKDQILFIYRIDGNRLYNIHIYQPQPDGKMTRTISANEGEFTEVPGENKIKLKLIDGTSDEPDLENPNNFYKLKFKTFFRTLDLMAASNKNVEKKPKSMPLDEIKDNIRDLRRQGIDATPLLIEFHRKISWSFSVLIFIMIGLPIAVVTHRREKTANIALALLCAAAYYLLTLGCEALCVQKIIPVAITMWIPNIIGAVIASILNYRLCVS
ncbi:MAG: LptF/LptG family permease, partial [Candidatus Omnitrophica bacterium]|nr:LptF/LptG family permease [Candidatus Omnitrophota bacterium]